MAALALCLTACSDDDDDNYPSYITNMVVVAVDATGTVSEVRLDNGTKYGVKSQGLRTEERDTLLRCMASYTIDGGDMTVTGLKHVFSDYPITLQEVMDMFSITASEVPRHPVNLISMWKSGGYLNIQVGVMTMGVSKHAFAFCEDAPGQYSLLHLHPSGDAASYTEKVFMSMPIPEGVGAFTFSVTTYDGVVTQTF